MQAICSVTTEKGTVFLKNRAWGAWPRQVGQGRQDGQPHFAVDCLCVIPHIRNEAENWVAEHRQQIISTAGNAGSNIK